MRKNKSTPTINAAIIIPAYNEGSAVRETVDAIPSKFTRIVCVNDGSSDDTLEQLQKTRAEIISHPINLGQGAALQTGIEYALTNPNIKYLVTYDADGQHRIEDVKSMLKYIQANKVDIVLGSRFLGKTENMPWVKGVILKLAVWFSNITTGVKLTDTHNGLRVMNRHAAERMQLKMPDFAHASEIIDRIAEEKLSYAEVPVTIVYTDYSRAKGQSMINSINIVFDVLLGKVVKK